MTDLVNSPKHYKNMSITLVLEPIALTSQLDFDLGNAFKYLFRYKNKGNPILDLQKAEYYLNHAFKYGNFKLYKKVLRESNLIFDAFVKNSDNFLKACKWDYKYSVRENLESLSFWLADEIKRYEPFKKDKNEIPNIYGTNTVKPKQEVPKNLKSALVETGFFTPKEAESITKTIEELHNTLMSD